MTGGRGGIRRGAVGSSLLALALLVVGLVATAVPATERKSPAPKVTASQVSDSSPFAAGAEQECSLDERNRGWEWETSIAADPNDGRRLAVAWLQDEALGIVVASTSDGGRTWRRSVVPKLTSCTGGTHNRVFHPRLAYSGNGTLFLASHPTSEPFPDPRNIMTDVYLSRSPDGGVTWDPPTEFVDLPVLGDFDTMTTEPGQPETVDVLWTEPEAVGPEPIYLSRSTDGGGNWTTSLVGRGSAGNVAFNQVVALPDGSIVVFIADTPISTFFPLVAGTQPIITSVTRSTDGGRTWSRPMEVARPSLEEWPQATVAPDGTLHYLYRTRDGGQIQAWLTSSTDGGETFSEPRRAFTYPEAEGAGATRPSFAAGASGRLGFFFYGAADDGDIQPRLTYSEDNGLTWKDVNLTSSFDPDPPFPGLGLYNTVVAVGCDFLASVPAGAPVATSGPTDVFAVTVDLRGCRV